MRNPLFYIRKRRKYIKRLGKWILWRVDRFIANQSTVPNDPVLDASHFPWSLSLEADWTRVRAELDELLKRREDIAPFQDISRDQKYISTDDRWRTYILYGFGSGTEAAKQNCPDTMRLLEQVPGLTTAFFSILAPHKNIPSHRGVSKAWVRCHLGLKIPRDAAKCTMQVGDDLVVWEEGKNVFFDDSYPHAVNNDTNEERVVLLFDFERPMRRGGRLVKALLLAMLRSSDYVKDAQRNQEAWERRWATD